MSPLFAMFGMPGGSEMIIILVIVLLLFGNRLPNVMRNMGRGIVEFKKGVKGIEEEFEDAKREVDEASKEPKD